MSALRVSAAARHIRNAFVADVTDAITKVTADVTASCQVCGRPFIGKENIEAARGMTYEEWRARHPRGSGGNWGFRSDARYCSNACRQKAYRSRRSP